MWKLRIWGGCVLYTSLHYFSRHLVVNRLLINAEKLSEAREYIQYMLNDGIGSKTEEVSRSGNIVVDSLVNHKYALAKKDNIRFEASVLIPSVLPFQEGHLAIIFGNLLDNALEACRKMPLQQRYIILDVAYKKEMLQIYLRNSSPDNQKKDSTGHYLTTKEDSRYHGIGLVSVEQALDVYDGELFIRHENGEFQVSALLYGNNNREI